MATKKNLTKESRIKQEVDRLTAIFEDLEPKRKVAAIGLIERAAHMRIVLEDLANDLDENGYVESFQQGKDNPPYDRKRPAADLYTTLNSNYQKAMKQLTDLLPKETAVKKDDGDGFEDFVSGRDD